MSAAGPSQGARDPSGGSDAHAAGHPHGVFKLHPRDLALLSDAPTADVTQAVPV